MKKVYFNVEPYINKFKECSWFLFFGQKSNGKTFSTIEYCIKQYVESGKMFAYVRRTRECITPTNITELMRTHDINKLTKGKWNSYEYKRNCFTFVNRDELTGEIIEKDINAFAMAFAINTFENANGADRGIFSTVYLDEFISQQTYLQNEFVKFMTLCLTISRDREINIILTGNTISPQCDYFNELGVSKEINKMLQGEYFIKEYGKTKILVKWCEKSNATSKVTEKIMNFSNERLRMIDSGKWQIPIYPHCNISYINKPYSIGGDVLEYVYIVYSCKIMCVAVVKCLEYPIFTHCYEVFKIPNEKNKPYIFSFDNELSINNYCSLENLKLIHREKLYKWIANSIEFNRMYFATNEIAEYFKKWYQLQRHYNTFTNK